MKSKAKSGSQNYNHHPPQSVVGFGIKEVLGNPRTVFVIDTNVLVIDPKAIDNLMDNSTNAVVIPWMVLSELDVLKNNSDLSRSVSEVVRVINNKLHAKVPGLYIVQGNIAAYSDLDRTSPDHHIIAVCLDIQRQHPQLPLTLVSNDAMVHTVGLRLGINVEEYKADQVDRVDFERPLPRISISELKQLGEYYQLNNPQIIDIEQNGGAVVVDDDGQEIWAAIRRGNILLPVSLDIEAMGISAFSMDKQIPNWAQTVALRQLLDPRISLITIHGEAGTGKTLLAIAAAISQIKLNNEAAASPASRKKMPPTAGKNQIKEQLEQSRLPFSRRRYRKIYIARPFVHLSNRDAIGFLPGDLEAKATPWLAPINDNINFIASRSERNTELIERIGQNHNNGGIEILPLSFIRGRTLSDVFVIIDEAQNLTLPEMKTIVTRIGENTKLVLVGDINQIDVRWIDKRSSGLTHVSVKMRGQQYFANVFLDQSVRSRIARDAAALL